MPIYIRLLACLFLGFSIPSISWSQKGEPATSEKAKLQKRDQWSNQTDQLRKQGKLKEAIAAAQNMLAIEKELGTKYQEDVFGSLEQIAQMQEEDNQWEAAKKTWQEILDLQTQHFGPDHWRVTDARLAMKFLEANRTRTPEQRKKLAEAKDLDRQSVGFYQKGNFPEVLRLLEIIAKIRQDILTENHPDSIRSLDNLAVIYEARTLYDKAESLRLQAKDWTRKLVGINHPLYIRRLFALAKHYESSGYYPQAETWMIEVKTQQQKLLGEKHPAVIETLKNLAEVYRSMGEYAKAEPIMLQAKDWIQELRGDNHPEYATIVNNLGTFYYALGEYTKAEPMMLQSLQIRKALSGENSPEYAASLNNLGHLYGKLNQYAKSEEFMLQAKAITQKQLGDHTPDYAIRLNNLAWLYERKKEYDKAEQLLLQALDLYKKALGEGHPENAFCLNNLASVYIAKGEYDQAEKLLLQVKTIRQKLGEKHLLYASSLKNLASLYHIQADTKQAEPLAKQAVQIVLSRLYDTAAIQSEQGQFHFLNSNQDYLHNLLSYTQASTNPTEVFALLLQWKGQIFVRQARQLEMKNLLSHPGSATAKLVEEYERVSRELGTTATLVPKPDQTEQWKQKLEDLTNRRDRLEAVLAKASARYREQLQQSNMTPAELQKMLPEQSSLLDFWVYRQTKLDDKTKRETTEEHLLAFVVRKDQIIRVELGRWEPIKKAIESWRSDLQRQEPIQRPRDPALVLMTQLWKPLAKHLDGMHTLFISPDRELAQMPFGALPGSQSTNFLLEEKAIAILPVPQFLPDYVKPLAKSDPSLLVLGDVQYDCAPGKPPEAVPARTALRGSRAFTWEKLNATRVELEAIGQSFQQVFPKQTLQTLQQDQATEEAIRQQAKRFRILHLATHGFFAPPQPEQPTQPDDPFIRMNALQTSIQKAHPGLLSGIVLAGANQPPQSDQDDGILTALEVTSLDLRNCELVVLSACETGLGKVAEGEGLLGLQRAFQVAGARNVISSLWKVEDEATAALMNLFYRNLWIEHQPPLQALRQAQITILKNPDSIPKYAQLRGVRIQEKDLGKSETQKPTESKRATVSQWAAFTLSGFGR